ncbi:MAG: sulfurtransferase TusA family protein [Wenzhouxiangella sp.]
MNKTRQSEFDRQLDVSGTLCPIPAIRTAQVLKEMSGGQVLEVLATDPLAEMDLAVLCERAGHEWVMAETTGDQLRVRIRVRSAHRSGAD